MAGHPVSSQMKRTSFGRLSRQGAASAVSEIAFTDARFRLRDIQMKSVRKEDFVPRGVQQLQEELDLPRAPELIEAIDVSHIQGSDAVAAVVAFKKGKPLKNRYRKLKLRSAKEGDDPAGIAEAVERHYKRLLDEKGFDQLPDLLLVDGGLYRFSLHSTSIARECPCLDSPKGWKRSICRVWRVHSRWLAGHPPSDFCRGLEMRSIDLPSVIIARRDRAG